MLITSLLLIFSIFIGICAVFDDQDSMELSKNESRGLGLLVTALCTGLLMVLLI